MTRPMCKGHVMLESQNMQRLMADVYGLSPAGFAGRICFRCPCQTVFVTGLDPALAVSIWSMSVGGTGREYR
jgi:hypothetical protein